jgi:hypothetical protein
MADIEPRVCAHRDCGRTDITAWTDMGFGPYFWCSLHADEIIRREPERPPQPIETYGGRQ